MRRTSLFVVALLFATIAPSAFGAAQLAAGAKTSAQPTSTNPQQRQLQITMDPTFTNNGEGPATNLANDQFHLDNFQLSVAYDSSKLIVDSLYFVPPFTENPVEISFAPPVFAVTPPPTLGQYYFDNGAGLISFISASADPNFVPPGDVNIFLVNFILKPGVSFDDPLFIKIFAGPGDFTHGTDPNSGDEAYSTADSIESTTLLLSFNQLTAAVGGPPFIGGVNDGSGGTGVPLPPGAWAGALLSAGLLGAGAVRRKLAAA